MVQQVMLVDTLVVLLVVVLQDMVLVVKEQVKKLLVH